jgi:hypothetical protein
MEYVVLRRRDIFEVERRDWHDGDGGDERGHRGYGGRDERIAPRRWMAYVLIWVPITRIYGGVGEWTPCGQSSPSSPSWFRRGRPLNADYQPSRIASDGNRDVLSLTRHLHPRKSSCREAPARLIRALREGSGTGLSALLLGLKNRRRYLGRAGASLFSMSAPKML